MTSSQPTIYTIGHGRLPISDFLELLRDNQIGVLADVRAIARSRWPQYNQKPLVSALAEAGIRYIHFPELGWKIQAPAADYARGIEELIALLSRERSCMMCAESLPDKCHRQLILTPSLIEQGVKVVHIYHKQLELAQQSMFARL